MFFKNLIQIDKFRQCYNDALTYAENRTLLQGKCVPTGGHQSLEVLSDQFKRILKEYLLSNDRDVVFSRVQELKVPHFNHEFVYQVSFFIFLSKFIKPVKYLYNLKWEKLFKLFLVT